MNQTSICTVNHYTITKATGEGDRYAALLNGLVILLELSDLPLAHRPQVAVNI